MPIDPELQKRLDAEFEDQLDAYMTEWSDALESHMDGDQPDNDSDGAEG